MKKTAVILVNLGTPESPTAKGVSDFLKLFLADQRVVELPKIFWWLLLRLIVIPLRAKKLQGHTKKYGGKDAPQINVMKSLEINAKDLR